MTRALAMLACLAAAPALAQQSELERAARSMQAGDYTTAIRLYEAALRAAPQTLDARFGLGQALYAAGRVVDAIPQLEQVRDATGGASLVQFVLGRAYLDAHRFGDAEAAFDAATLESPDVAQLAFFRGELCYRIGRGDEAARRFRRAAELAPPWDAPHVRLGALELDRRRPEAAIAPLRAALQRNPAGVDAAMLLAIALSGVERPEEGLAVLERAAASASDSLPVALVLSERYDRLSRAEALRVQANRVLELQPEHPVPLLQLARDAELRADPVAALAYARRAVASFARVSPSGIEPETWNWTPDQSAEALRMLADLQRRTGDAAGARVTAERLVAEFPRFPGGHFLLGTLLNAERDPAGRVHLRRFKQLSDAAVLTDLGNNLLAEDDGGPLAAVQFERALAIDSDDPAALIGLAEARRRTGAANDALDLLARARALRPAPDAWYRGWILALAAAGRHDEIPAAHVDARRLGLDLGYEVNARVFAGIDACRPS